MAGSTRQALIDAATQLLDDGGEAGVTLREVGRRAGVSHNAPYKHFTDKDDLLAAVAARELDAYARILIDARRDGRELAYAMRGYVARALAYPRRFRLVYRPWQGDYDDLRRAADAAWSALLEAVDVEREGGKLPATVESTRVAELIRALANGVIDLEFAGHLNKDQQATMSPDGLVADFLALLGDQAGVQR
ncbi:TetR/AcrR family transcriptional regulator [Phytoactinopolyspora halotolerans]|uniref:TetR/AcrR family transcriptional regulator n=1 Tax=Phytoactinopolyspora halotolerans TaxID=1981512 RepID=A0A6L9SHS7_9ACTN|nr:TetR/AcrR family transcriptional regulator [Phytoactinopolyspora halotolerans]NEE04208.1 TetR/AcrR family transcriptional regulator [Phytoactinopolyspora halotolerans]